MRLAAMLIGVMVLCLFFVPFKAHADNGSLCLNADDQFHYALSLADQHNYDLALVELSRFERFFPDDPRLNQARYTTGLCYMESGNLEKARHCFEALMEDEKSGSWGVEAYFMMARYHERTGNPILAEISLKNLITLTADTSVKDRAYNAIAWLRLETAQWDHAKALLGRISAENKAAYHVDEMLSELEKTGQIPHKSPNLAGTLAIVPGAGYFYCGRYRDALVAFLVNGGLILAAYESFDHDQPALGGVITFVGFGFYAGNIYGSASSAHKYNRAAHRDFISRLKHQVLPSMNLGMWSPADHYSPGLAMRFHF